MATLLDKTYDIPHGSVVARVQDALGNISVHTIYVMGLAGTVDDAIALILANTATAATELEAAFVAAGWTPGNNGN